MASLGAPLAFPLGGEATVVEALSEDYPHTALVLLFEGYDLGVTDSADHAAIATAWGAVSGWSNIVPGLRTIGTIEQSAMPFDSEVQMPGMSFVVVDDDDDTIAALLLRESNDEAITQRFTNLTAANMDCESPSILLDDSSNFPDTGTVYIGTEEIEYLLNGGGGLLTNLTRGIRALFGTETDLTHFAQPHRLDFNPDDPDEPLHAPIASSAPLQWIGRRVGLFLCVENDGVWTAGPDAECVWAGTIRGLADDGLADQGIGGLAIECESILKRLETPLLRRQYKAHLQEGGYFVTAQGFINVELGRFDAAGDFLAYGPASVENIFATDGVYSHEDVAALINAQLVAWGGDFDTMDLVLSLEEPDDTQEPRYVFTLTDSPGATHWSIRIGLTSQVWDILGWDGVALDWYTSSIGLRELRSNHRELPNGPIAPGPPLGWGATWLTTSGVMKLSVEDEDPAGEFAIQPYFPPETPEDTEGFLRIGGAVILPVKQTGTPGEFEITGLLPQTYEALGFSVGARDRFDKLLDLMRSLRNEGAIVVEQVWLETGFADEIVMRLLCSTGTDSYNTDDWDKYPEQMGLGLPFRMLDQVSIMGEIGGGRFVLFVEKPTSFLTYFESVLQVRNLHAFWHRGKLTVAGFGETDEATVSLTEDNKAQAVDGSPTPVIERSVAMRTLDFLVNRIALRYNIPLGNQGGGKPDTITVNNTASQTDLVKVAPVTVDALGFYDLEIVGDGALVDDWNEEVASVALAYFGGPLMLIERSFDYSLFVILYPGLPVLFSDDHVMNTRTGVRGVVDLPCWVVAASKDYGTGVGRVRLLHRPPPVLTPPGPSDVVVDLLDSGSFDTVNGATEDYESGAFDLEADHLYVICIASRPATGVAGELAAEPTVTFQSLDEPSEFVDFEVVGPLETTVWEGGTRRMTVLRGMSPTAILNGTFTIGAAIGPDPGDVNAHVYAIADVTGVEPEDNGANAIVQWKFAAMTPVGVFDDNVFITFDDAFEAEANGALAFWSNHAGGACAAGDGWMELEDIDHPSGGSLGRMQLEWRPDNDTTPSVTGAATDWFGISLELRAYVP